MPSPFTVPNDRLKSDPAEIVRPPAAVARPRLSAVCMFSVGLFKVNVYVCFSVLPSYTKKVIVAESVPEKADAPFWLLTKIARYAVIVVLCWPGNGTMSVGEPELVDNAE